MTYGPEHVIFESKMTVADLIENLKYMDEDADTTLTKKQIDELSEMVNTAVMAAVEDFMNHKL
jgi:hypothetical protein